MKMNLLSQVNTQQNHGNYPAGLVLVYVGVRNKEGECLLPLVTFRLAGVAVTQRRPVVILQVSL